jgi:hypothetical protein
MKTFKVSVEWKMTTVFEVEAESLAAAVNEVQTGNPTWPCEADHKFVRGSFEVNEETTAELNKEV